MKIAIEKSLTEFALRQSQERSYMEWLLEEDVRLGVGSCGILIVAQWKPTRLVSMRMQFRSLASLSGLRIHVAVSWGVGPRHDSDLALLWLWHSQKL